MAGRRTTRSDLPQDPAAVMRALRACRDAMVEVLRCVKPMGPTYHAASMVVSAIDGFAAFLTGQRYYFSQIGSGATAGEVEADREKLAVEDGEKPWPR